MENNPQNQSHSSPNQPSPNGSQNQTFSTPGGQPPYAPYNNIKSSTTAGILGIFLGAFGAHNWYLGERNKGTIHICLFAGSIIGLILGAILFSLAFYAPIISILGALIVFIAYCCLIGNAIWGFIEGIIILAQGDAALAAKGYTVATPIYSQPYQPNPYQPNSYPQYQQPQPTPLSQPSQSVGNSSPVQSPDHDSNHPKPKPQHPSKSSSSSKSTPKNS